MNDQIESSPPTGIDRTARAVAEVKTFDPGLGSYAFDNLGDVVRFADLMSKAGEMLPEHLRSKPALCLAVTMRATQWGFDPFALAMETYQAKPGGPVGYQAKVFTGALTQAGVKLRYRYEGEIKMLDKPVTSYKGNEIAKRTATGDRKCIAYAVIDGDTLEYQTMTLDQITIKNSPMWHNDPDQQLAYAAGRGWARRYRADVIMGAYSDDEVREMSMKDVTPRRDDRPNLAQRLTANPVEKTDMPAGSDERPDTGDVIDGQAETPAKAERSPYDALDASDAAPGSQAWDRGLSDFDEGKPISDCPYDVDTPEAVDYCGAYRNAARARQ